MGRFPKLGEKVWAEGQEVGGGGNFEKKMQTKHTPSKHEFMQQISSKSDNGKVLKIRRKGKDFDKNANITNDIPK